MIKEDYCSYKVAKLLKEKGFKEPCFSFYENNLAYYTDSARNWNVPKSGATSRPTLQMAMKWLRVKHNICISTYAAAYRYGFTIEKADTGSNICNEDVVEADPKCMEYSYEQAAEAALKYSLENLI